MQSVSSNLTLTVKIMVAAGTIEGSWMMSEAGSRRMPHIPSIVYLKSIWLYHVFYISY